MVSEFSAMWPLRKRAGDSLRLQDGGRASPGSSCPPVLRVPAVPAVPLAWGRVLPRGTRLSSACRHVVLPGAAAVTARSGIEGPRFWVGSSWER